jgi:hypothetical protein
VKEKQQEDLDGSLQKRRLQMNNTDQTLQQQIQTKLNRFNTLLTKALQQHNQALFSMSVGALLELQDLLFPISQTTPTEASTELITETSTNQTIEQNL